MSHVCLHSALLFLFSRTVCVRLDKSSDQFCGHFDAISRTSYSKITKARARHYVMDFKGKAKMTAVNLIRLHSCDRTTFNMEITTNPNVFLKSMASFYNVQNCMEDRQQCVCV